MDHFSFLSNAEPAVIEAAYRDFLRDPDSVEESWKKFFLGFDFAVKHFGEQPVNDLRFQKEFKVLDLIQGYRIRGHLFTQTNPVRTRRKYFPTLDLENFGLSADDLSQTFQAGTEIGIGPAPLSAIVAHLNDTYCRSVGVEYWYMREPEIIQWLQSRMEATKNQRHFSREDQMNIFRHLVEAVGFERFIHKKFVGQKRFSLEGAENLIPALDRVVEKGAELGIEEFVIGMAHRGRLNVLANIMRKPYENIFKEFSGNAYEEGIVYGDVKYHLGYVSDVRTDTGKSVRLNLVPNPSHLETVSGVVQGLTRARIDHTYGGNYDKAAAILIHGDAAIAAQGIVYEVLQMSQLEGYRTGGTIHLIINNQVGFTTNYLEARSSTYCTDVAKTVKSPVFHVNGDDVEAMVYTIMLAMEFRAAFHRDVFIDILCYRKYGHNEGDEPRFTQPTLYKEIEKHPNPRDIYAASLMERGLADAAGLKDEETRFDKLLEEKLALSLKMPRVKVEKFLAKDWEGFHFADEENVFDQVLTGVDIQKLKHLASRVNDLPQGLSFFKKIVKLVEDRRGMIEAGQVDWALAELLAYATLLDEGMSVRLSGQDSVRGTFSHRHAAYVVDESDQKYMPLKHLAENQPPFEVFNSLLSEYGVLGFEYGYALATPTGLTIWEAQFGDFHNVAQVIIDQYISSAEDKWGLMNGLVLYLPHGYEGQGPEHSSARMERFLTLCAETNMQIVNCSTPASFFHVLRRQMVRDFRIPLIIFTPKSLLRHPACISKLQDLSFGTFQEVIDDPQVDVEQVSRVVFCSGKVYYDLLEKKKHFNASDLALVRLEQLFPFPEASVKAVYRKYRNAMLHLWVQEEPENMGAWRFVSQALQQLNLDIEPVTRLGSGSPAVGLHQLHLIGQNEIINKVFRKCDCELLNNYCGLQCVKGRSREEIKKQHRYFILD